jgi:hypothetical protein
VGGDGVEELVGRGGAGRGRRGRGRRVVVARRRARASAAAGAAGGRGRVVVGVTGHYWRVIRRGFLGGPGTGSAAARAAARRVSLTHIQRIGSGGRQGGKGMRFGTEPMCRPLRPVSSVSRPASKRRPTATATATGTACVRALVTPPRV